MKKDVLVAVLIGFILGAAVALTATNLPKILAGIKIPSVKPSVSPTPVVVPKSPSPEFDIDNPKDESISETKSLSISGHAKAGQTVLIETQTDQKVLQVDDTGAFSSKLDLSEGVNNIYLTLYDELGNANSKTLNIYYTSEKL